MRVLSGIGGEAEDEMTLDPYFPRAFRFLNATYLGPEEPALFGPATWEQYRDAFVAAAPAAINDPTYGLPTNSRLTDLTHVVIDAEWWCSSFIENPSGSLWSKWQSAGGSESSFWEAMAELHADAFAVCKAERPWLRWGFYNTPGVNFYTMTDAYTSEPYASRRTEWESLAASELAFMTGVVDFHCPSCYLNNSFPVANVRSFLREVLSRDGRYHRFFGYRNEVCPALWFANHDGTLDGDGDLDDSMVDILFDEMRSALVDTAVVWGYVPDSAAVNRADEALQASWYPRLDKPLKVGGLFGRRRENF